MSGYKKFFIYVIPSVLAFALSGVYAVVDGYFVGNSVGDIGLSVINIAYPVVALIQAVGVGIGMGGAVYYSINRAENKEKKAKEFVACTIWMLISASIFMTAFVCIFITPLLKMLGAEGKLLTLGEDYLFVMALGTVFQVMGTGLVPLIRNNGGATFAMFTMIAGFITNIALDYQFVWVYNWSTEGAALATIAGQGITMIGGLFYLIKNHLLNLKINLHHLKNRVRDIIKVGIAPFGLTLTPNFSLVLINRFSVFYGGQEAVAVYACISYIISVVYLILQGVGDGSQPLMSQYYGEKNIKNLRSVRKCAYGFSLFLSFIGIVILFTVRWKVGGLLGASDNVTREVAHIFPIFLLAVPFIAVNRITTASFYATEKNILSYILTYIEPVAMLVLLLILPPLFGGQIMIWWGTAFARIFSAVLAIIFKYRAEKSEKIFLESQNLVKV